VALEVSSGCRPVMSIGGKCCRINNYVGIVIVTSWRRVEAYENLFLFVLHRTYVIFLLPFLSPHSEGVPYIHACLKSC
jgi:hypothetical protein